MKKNISNAVYNARNGPYKNTTRCYREENLRLLFLFLRNIDVVTLTEISANCFKNRLKYHQEGLQNYGSMQENQLILLTTLTE